MYTFLKNDLIKFAGSFSYPTLIVSFFLDEISRTLCGSDESSVDTFSNTAKLKFKSLSSSRGSNLGFLASINASVEACGGTLEGSTGTIQTPGIILLILLQL